MITVIVPFKDAAQWIGRCAESLHQLKGDAEFIFVDDFSKDCGSYVVADMDDDRFVLTMNAHTQGVSGARNTGLDIAKGDWITFLDADDEYAPGALNALNASIYMFGDADLIQLNHVRVLANGNQMPRMFNARGKYGLNGLPKLWMSSCNKIFRASLIQDIRFREDLKHGEDELFVLECLKRTRCIYNSEHIALHYHKDNPNSLSTITSFDDLIGEQRALLDFLYENFEDIELCEAVRIRQTELWSNAVYKRTIGGTV